MVAFLRRLFDILFAWIILIGCIAFIGYIAWPILSEKFSSLCSNPEWEFCRGEWNTDNTSDQIQKTIEAKTTAFFDIAHTAMSDVLTDNGGKRSVKYELSKEVQVYLPVPVEQNN
jgi:hypothetical protein